MGFGDLSIEAERQGIQARRAEVEHLAAADQSQLDGVAEERRAVEVSLRQMLADLDQRTEAYVSPRFEAIADLSARIADAESRTRAVQETLRYWERARTLTSLVAELTTELESAKNVAASAHAALAQRREILVELSSAFDEIVRLVEPPWYESAHIDQKTYLPVLNGASFQSLSGGEKTIVNVAYHLALLTVALARRDTLLPATLIIDTPRKNLGAGEDQALAVAMYRRIRALVDAYPAALQMIVADNDPPPIQLEGAQPIMLSYERPLIPDLEHPGPDVETLEGSSD